MNLFAWRKNLNLPCFHFLQPSTCQSYQSCLWQGRPWRQAPGHLCPRTLFERLEPWNNTLEGADPHVEYCRLLHCCWLSRCRVITGLFGHPDGRGLLNKCCAEYSIVPVTFLLSRRVQWAVGVATSVLQQPPHQARVESKDMLHQSRFQAGFKAVFHHARGVDSDQQLHK